MGIMGIVGIVGRLQNTHSTQSTQSTQSTHNTQSTHIYLSLKTTSANKKNGGQSNDSFNLDREHRWSV